MSSTPLARLNALARRGAAGGAIGTLAMDAVLYRRYRSEGGAAGFSKWEFRSVPASFADAPAPAKVGQLIAEKAHRHLADSRAGATNNVVHWSTGISWGVFAAALRLVPGVGPLKAGVLAGVTAWATSYLVLPRLKIYKPMSEYDAKTLWKDLSAHLAFGAAAGTCGALAKLASRRPSQ